MCRRKIENRDQLLADVDAYIRDHSPVSLEELVQAMQELGHDCTPRMVRPLLKERGLTVKSVNGRWFWGMWDDDESDDDDVDESDDDDVEESDEQDDDDDEDDDDDDDEDDDDDDEDDDEDDDDADDDDDERPVSEPLKKAEAENKRLQSENHQLIAALLKTTQLKKSIQAMQKKLLVELADLIRATYGESESETQESDQKTKTLAPTHKSKGFLFVVVKFTGGVGVLRRQRL